MPEDERASEPESALESVKLMPGKASKRKIPILLLARVFPPRIGGIENYIYNIYRRLSEDFQIKIVTPNWPGSQSFDLNQRFQVIRSPRIPLLGERRGSPLLGMGLRAIREALKLRPAQIHCDQIETAIVGKLLARMLGVPYLVYAYAMEITDNNYVQLKKWAIGGASAVLAISRYTRSELISCFSVPAENIHLVHPGVDINRFHTQNIPQRVIEKYGLNGKRVILTVGRLASTERYKGHRMIIQVLPVILEQVPEAVYMIVGDGPDRTSLESLVRDQGFSDRVIFAGAVSDEDLPDYYAACDVFAMPSSDGKSKKGGVMTEGFGIVFLEAGASGKPVIATLAGGIPDAVVDGKTGILVAQGDSDHLCQAIINILKDGELANRLGNAGRRHAEAQFQWHHAAMKSAEVFFHLARESECRAGPVQRGTG